MVNNQPTKEQKLQVLQGQSNGWDFKVKVPPVCTSFWSHDDWITYIGDNWYQTKQEVNHNA